MILARLKTVPSLYPVTLLELKYQLYLDSVSFADQIAIEQSIAPGEHAIAAGYTLVGDAVDVQAYDALVSLNVGECGSGGTVDVKIQESANNVTFTDWSGGAFTQVTAANDNAVYEKEYTGVLRYIRVVATVAVAACSFAVDVVVSAPNENEDDKLNAIIATATKYVEDTVLGGVSLINQTWYLYPDTWPGGDTLELSRPPVSAVSAVEYAEADDTDYDETFAASNYALNTIDSPQCLQLAYGASWPTATLRSWRPIRITVTSGFGATAASVPDTLKQLVLLTARQIYENPDMAELKLPLSMAMPYRRVKF